MNNIIFEKVWQDSELIELKITAKSEFVTAYQNCYVQNDNLEEISEKICRYSQLYNEDCYVEFGKKRGDYTPAFSMKIMKPNTSGHLKIEVDVEIDDINNRSHRCCYYVESELGAIDKLGVKIKKLIADDVGCKVLLYSNEL
ncbi:MULTISPECIES: hypothetical protein [unclassified Clostridium]|uniref:hypothetical protein n=1 Tax=unclassified Clostridium TaxID=2614128 RepID=UPI0013F10DC7|nr:MULTISPECIES: hypothetical protein [unclassified Clostridium]MBN1045279.1 hypothetical protein [Clostridium botulinum]NFG61452.1 hypothetical protein [Clostridium botulinum]NFN94262.1 hypothetical protein [Clostridium botulinum]NFQ10434.1 hypothetical protein [Clostridium botulinum]NFS29614.1 hypothetical protein [Clostridium botulinum]